MKDGSALKELGGSKEEEQKHRGRQRTFCARKKEVNRDAVLGKAQSVDSITLVGSLKKKKRRYLIPDHEGPSDQVTESIHQRLVSH